MTRGIGSLGRIYQDGEVVIRQGEQGDCMYVIQEGQVEVTVKTDGQEVRVAVRGANEFFGEMALFTREVRGATVRALGQARLLTLDKKTFLRRMQQDPSLAFRVMETMSHRIQELSEEVARRKAGGPATREAQE